MDPTPMRTITWSTLILLLAVAVAACGGSTQAITGTAPSIVSPMADSADGTLSLLKEGNGKGSDKGGHAPTPTTGSPTTEVEEGDAPEDGHGQGHATKQIEGFSVSITGTCQTLTITINDVIVKTNENTEFQRAACEELADPEATSFHLHIAAKMTDDGLIATYVRMQGPKAKGGEDAEETETTPTT
jgi:hypothetical protein